jgi:hypothetical protein
MAMAPSGLVTVGPQTYNMEVETKITGDKGETKTGTDCAQAGKTIARKQKAKHIKHMFHAG